MPHHKRKAEPLTPAELERVRRLYMETDVPNTEIGRRYGRRPNWVNMLADKHGWPTRKSLAPKPAPNAPSPATIDGRKVRNPTRRKLARSVKQIILDAKAADADRERALYGANVADVMLLRRRGFVVTRTAAGYTVGNAECTIQQMRAKADRERRIAGRA